MERRDLWLNLAKCFYWAVILTMVVLVVIQPPCLAQFHLCFYSLCNIYTFHFIVFLMSAVIFIFRKTLIFTAKWSLCNLKCRKLPGCIVTNDKGGVANDIEINAGIQLGPNYQHYGLVLADWHLDMDPPQQFSHDRGQVVQSALLGQLQMRNKSLCLPCLVHFIFTQLKGGR